jgi:hypothetical protein|tara:strand:+ start:339 stop:854 length:516 start_codon:yes stop_codon:yes gene_type:complete
MADDSLNNLGSIVSGEHKPQTPPTDKMIEFGMEMLKNSSIGMELVMFAQEQNLEIKVVKGMQETSYVPDEQQVVISLKTVDPAQPSRFVLLLAGAIREVMQIKEGMRPANINENMSKILEKTRAKQGDKIAYMCAVAYEINELSSFTEYNLMEELRKMGYGTDVATFLDNV